jgi:hypothetical protein
VILARVNLDVLAQHLENSTTPLLRTDFADDVAWAKVASAVTAGADFGPDELNNPEAELYEPNIEPIENRAFEGATGTTLAAAIPLHPLAYVLLADARVMREALVGAELTVVYVDLSVDEHDAAEFGWIQGREFRCEVGEIASIEANLSIANMDFAEFADAVDPDGVFRGFRD